jgi:hypothetical protein
VEKLPVYDPGTRRTRGPADPSPLETTVGLEQVAMNATASWRHAIQRTQHFFLDNKSTCRLCCVRSMKKVISRNFAGAVVLSLVTASVCSSGGTIGSGTRQVRLTPHDKLYDVFFWNERRGWIVGARGLIARPDWA